MISSSVSIHPPRAGCDAQKRRIACARFGCFNSRTPCGVRRIIPHTETDNVSFNSRTPCGVRHSSAPPDHLTFVSIHAPRAGCDRPQRSQNSCRRCFNSRTPCGVRRAQKGFRFCILGVSIHAPRAGCDNFQTVNIASRRRFQFTHPVRGATLLAYFVRARKFRFNSRTPCGVRRRNNCC